MTQTLELAETQRRNAEYRYEVFRQAVVASGVDDRYLELEAEVDGIFFYADLFIEKIFVYVPNTRRIAEPWDMSDEDGIVPWLMDDHEDDIREALSEARRLSDPDWDWRTGDC